MKDLNQLNQELEQIDEQRETLLDKIAELAQIETNKKNDTYSYLIGKCFKYDAFANCYFKIIDIVRISWDKKIQIKVILRRDRSIHDQELNFETKSVTEIPLEQFESILKQTFNNILNTK